MKKGKANNSLPFTSLAKHKTTYILIAIFIIAFLSRLWGIAGVGRTVDEEPGAQEGYKLTELALHGNFTDDFWWKYSPDHPPLTKYIRGIVTRPDIIGFTNDKRPIFSYDFYFARTFSTVLVAFTAVMVAFIALRFISVFTAIASGIIFSLIPHLLGHSQSIMWEPYILFFFTATIASFLCFLQKPTRKLATLTGICLGLSVLVKESNILLPPLMALIFLVWWKFSGRKDSKKRLVHIVYIYITGLLLFFMLWPMPFYHLDYIIPFTQKLRLSNTLSIPEVFFGRLLLVPKSYYPIYLLITTPILILTLVLFGIKDIAKNKQWYVIAILVWFTFPFIQTLYPMRQHGLRYIIEIYAPLSIIAAYGLDNLFPKILTNNWLKSLSLLLVAFSSIIPLYKIAPYYYDYFNILVGGTRHVYNTRSFQQGWWGQGAKEAGEYLYRNASSSARVGIAISPGNHVMPQIKNMHMIPYQPSEEYDYIVLNHYNIIREGFDDSSIKKHYNMVYAVDADGAKLVYIYKKR
jgi:4-amino-4-deoxy-L-arabinose transferase-like glycosyltransferase